MTGPYAEAAWLYRQAGWAGVLPLPPRAKWPPPGGYTGWAGVEPSGADVQAWVDGPEGAGNIALRLPHGVYGLDVDAYGGKSGGDAFAVACERLGALPDTWTVTSRDDGVSGIRLYRAELPVGRRWKDEPAGHGAGIEAIHFGHRYAVVYPSVHPDTGQTYGWYGPDGELVHAHYGDMVPRVDELPEMPAAWVEALSEPGEAATGEQAGHGETLETVTGFPAGQACDRIREAAARGLERLREARDGAALHPAGRDATHELVRLGHEGHSGARRALAEHFGVFTDVRVARGMDQRSAEAEWWRCVRGAVGKLSGNSRELCDCALLAGEGVQFDAPIGTGLQGAGGEAPASEPAGVEGGGGPFALLRPRLASLHEAIRDEAVRRAVAHEAGEVVKAWVREREAVGLPAPALTALGDLLDEPDEGPSWRIAGLWPAGGRVVLSAQFKTGKTTLTGNLVRCLADGSPFLDASDPLLGSFEVTPLSEGERVAVIDLELSRRQLREWLRDQGIDNRDRVHVETLRGRLGEFDLGNPDRRAAWARLLRDLGVRVLVIDPLAPLLTASGTEENDNAGVARVLGALDDLCETAGVAELLVTHHMGHNGERSRGASRLRDWPDAEWKLVRESTDDGEPVHGAPRYFSALGRDVEVSETQLHFDQRTRRLGILGGNRTEQKQTRARAEVLRAVRETPGATGRQMETAGEITGVSRALIRDTLGRLVKNGELHTWNGPRNAIHYLAGCNCSSGRNCVNAELAASGEKVSTDDQQAS